MKNIVLLSVFLLSFSLQATRMTKNIIDNYLNEYGDIQDLYTKKAFFFANAIPRKSPKDVKGLACLVHKDISTIPIEDIESFKSHVKTIRNIQLARGLSWAGGTIFGLGILYAARYTNFSATKEFNALLALGFSGLGSAIISAKKAWQYLRYSWANSVLFKELSSKTIQMSYLEEQRTISGSRLDQGGSNKPFEMNEDEENFWALRHS